MATGAAPINVREILSVRGALGAGSSSRRWLTRSQDPRHSTPSSPNPQLQNLGIQNANITFTNVTLESEKYICVRETSPTNQLVGSVGVGGKGGNFT